MLKRLIGLVIVILLAKGIIQGKINKETLYTIKNVFITAIYLLKASLGLNK